MHFPGTTRIVHSLCACVCVCVCLSLVVTLHIARCGILVNLGNNILNMWSPLPPPAVSILYSTFDHFCLLLVSGLVIITNYIMINDLILTTYIYLLPHSICVSRLSHFGCISIVRLPVGYCAVIFLVYYTYAYTF